MRRIRDSRENETEQNVRTAFENFADGKRKRKDIREYEKHIDENVRLVLADIINETFAPQGYTEELIFDKKPRRLAKAPIRDHHTEAAAILPYERKIYDYISWRAPAVRPGLGTHAMFRFVRNELYRFPQLEVGYYIQLDIHHYFPRMDHEILKRKVDNLFKKGKLRTFIYKVIDSYPRGAPLGIKVAQLFGMIDLADFDRMAERFFGIADDPEKMAYWTSRFITEKIMTARSRDAPELGMGSQYLAGKFERYAHEGLRHYFRFVDNILIVHQDKTFLRLARDLVIMHLTRDYRAQMNSDYNVRPVWMGIRLCGYVFYHDHTEVAKKNKQNLARKIARLKKKGLSEEQIRIRLSSQIGYVKHADSINLFKKLGMEKSLGKIIQKRRVRPPFKGMTAEQKVNFSTIVAKVDQEKDPVKIFLTDYVIMDSKLEKETVAVQVTNSDGKPEEIVRQQPGKVLAIRFKKIIKTFVTTNARGEEEETYIFEKKRDAAGEPTEQDAEFYTFSGSRIMTDQAQRDFSPEDLPAPTIIQQFRGKDNKLYTKFT